MQELELESLLGSSFVYDTIARVPKGEFGGDVLQRVVMNQTGAVCGTILWESKRTKSWSEGWLAKLRQDQRAAKADIAVIVSQALPKGVKQFELMDGVYVVSPQCVRPVAEMLRGLLVEANELLKLREQKLAEAQRAQAELIRKQREVEEQKRELELTVEKRVSEAIGAVRSKARQEVESELKPPASQGRAGLAAAAGRGAGAGARVAARQRLRLRHDHARAEGRVRRRCAASGGDESDGRGVRDDSVGVEEDEDVE